MAESKPTENAPQVTSGEDIATAASDSANLQEPLNDETGPAQAGGTLGRNVVANVAGQLVFVLTGFILPRLVFDRIGFEMLGVWDFGWSIVAHLMLVGGGMMSVVSRDVARFAAMNNVEELRRLISSCFVLFVLCGLCALGLALAVTRLLPTILPSLPPELLDDARAVVFLLGLSVTVRFSLHVFNGIITGHQRYVLHNIIVGGTYLASAFVMVMLVVLGCGLVTIAATYLVGELVSGVLKLWFARRICPDWRIGWRFVRRSTIVHVITFGGKTMLGAVSRVLLYQTNAALVGYYLGVESLAIFARSRSLVLTVDRILLKMGMVFTPRASFLQARGDKSALQRSLYISVEYSLYIAIPAVLLLTILGGPILEVWMGGKFSRPGLLAILAAGHLIPLSQRGTYHILMGMGRHGWPALAQFIAALLGTALAVLLLGWSDLGLVGAAVAIVLPITVVDAVILPMVARRNLGIDMGHFLYRTWARPVTVALPFAAVLLVCRVLPMPNVAATVGLAVTLGAAVYGAVCWRFVLTPTQRTRVLGVLICWRGGGRRRSFE